MPRLGRKPQEPSRGDHDASTDIVEELLRAGGIRDGLLALRRLYWTNPADIAHAAPKLLELHLVLKLNPTSADRIVRVKALGRIIDTMLKRIRTFERQNAPNFARSRFFAGALLLRRAHLLKPERADTAELARADLSHLRHEIEQKWQVTRGGRKGQAMAPGSFRANNEDALFDDLAFELASMEAGVRPARPPSPARGAAASTSLSLGSSVKQGRGPDDPNGESRADALEALEVPDAPPGRIPILNGRWQPFHRGHHAVLASILSHHPQAILSVVNPDPDRPPAPTFERFARQANPFNYWERLWMLTRLLRDEGWENRVRIIPSWHPRASIEQDARYLPPPRQRFWYVPYIDESEEQKVVDFRSQGETVIALEDLPAAVLSYRATLVRRRLAAGRGWEPLLPAAIARSLRPPARPDGPLAVATAVDLPIFAGRWQPLHNGHLWAIRHLLETHDELVIGIVNPELTAEWRDYPSFHPVHNPFTFWDRLQMLAAVLNSEGLLSRVYITPLWHPREDVPSSEAFIPPNRTWMLPATSQHEREKAADYAAQGERIELFDVPNPLGDVSSAQVRLLLGTGDDSWRTLVPPAVNAYIDGILGDRRVAALISEYQPSLETYLNDPWHARKAT